MLGRSWSIIVAVPLFALGCGGSEFQSSETSDGGSPEAAAGSGGTSGTGGTAGTGGEGGSGGSGGTAAGGSAGASGTGGATGGTGGVAGSGGEDAGTVCTTECLPLPPPDWNGPVAFHSVPASEDAVDCAGYFGTDILTGLEDITGPPATCDCVCNTSATKVILECYEGTLCQNTPCATAMLSDGTCSPAPTTCSGAIRGVRTLLHPDSCEPQLTEDIPPVAVGGQVTVCGAQEQPPMLDCDAGKYCRPPDPLPVCIWRTGDYGCPPGLYKQQHLVYQSFQDDRHCSECSCGISSSVGNVSLYGGTACSNLDQTIPVPSTCKTAPTEGVGFSAKFIGAGSPKCDPEAPSQPMGAISMIDVTSVCCL